MTNGSDICFAGDVAATLEFGFSSIKIDSCGNQRNMTHYAQLFNRSGKAVMLEGTVHKQAAVADGEILTDCL